MGAAPRHLDRRQRFEWLFDAHYAAVLAYALRRAPRVLAEEAASDTFVVAWRRLDRVPDDAVPWLYGVARRQLADQHRSQRRTGALLGRLREGSADAGGDDMAAVTDGLDARWARALSALSAREREAILLVAWGS